MSPGPPSRIADRFEIERPIAEGGMGIVYRARDLHTDGLAAIKLMREASASGAERFAREARVLAEFRHPGIVRYLTHGRTDGGELFLAMEWLEGEDLEQRLRSAELTSAQTLRLAVQVAAALAAAHARGIVHRDLKPANLFLVEDRIDRVKLLDFGVARVARLDAMTATGLVVGTPHFMAPEQARGERGVDARADVFAFGAVLYRCLSGRRPFGGATPAEVLGSILHHHPLPLGDAQPRELGDLALRMLAKDPAHRPRDAAAVLEELVALDDVTPAAARRPERAAATELTGEERPIHCVLAFGRTDARVAAIAATHGGLLEDDGLRVGLSGQRVASDQAKLAARCALALGRQLPDLAMALVMGRHADAAARAQALVGEPGTIRIDETLAGLLDARFQVTGDARGLLLGGELPADDDVRPLLGKATAFVGRDGELAQLEALLAGAVSDSQARAVLVSAPAGAGKSRLRLELCRSRSFWIGRGEPMRAGAPFGLLGEAVRRAAGIAGDEPLATRRALLAERVGRHLPEDRVARVAELVGELAGVPFPSEDSPQLRAARRDPVLLAERLRAAWVEWLDAECGAGPVVLVLEDLHWGDLPTVKLVDHALGALAERPLFVLALARPEVHDLFPRLWAERGLQEIHLGALPRRSAERLVRLVLGDLDAAGVAAVVERAGGNPFYLEELIRHVAERGSHSLPETVLAMVGERFQKLGPEVRRALRAASVFGEVFWAEGVAALLGARPPLEELVERELVSRRRDARLSHMDELAFRHSLLREAAYALLTDEDRVLGHRLAGDWLERAGEPEALVLAEHFERGRDAPRAARWFARAAEQALAGNDPAAAIARAERGVTAGAAGEELGGLRLTQAIGYRVLADVRTAPCALEAVDLLPRGGEPWFRAVAEAAMACAMRYQAGEVRRLAEEALAAAADPLSAAATITLARIATQCGLGRGPEALHDVIVRRLSRLPASLEGDPGVFAYVVEALSYGGAVAARPDEWYEQADLAQRLFRAAGDDRNACYLGIQLGAYEIFFGDHEAAERRARQQMTEATRLGLANLVRGAHLQLSQIDIHLGRPAEAVNRARQAMATTGETLYPALASGYAVALGRALAAAGALDEAERVVRAAIASSEPSWPITRWAITLHGRVLARLGRGDEALAVLATADADADDRLFFLNATLAAPTSEHHLALVLAHRSLGQLDEARRAAARARAWLDAHVRQVVAPDRWASCARQNPIVAQILALDAELNPSSPSSGNLPPPGAG